MTRCKHLSALVLALLPLTPARAGAASPRAAHRAGPAIPSPSDFLGMTVGADREVHEVHRGLHEAARENPEGYAHTALPPRAKDLHGRLLLVFGTYDDNVHPQNSWAFVDGLVAAKIPFDMMVYPMRKHGIEDRPARIHLFSKMLEFSRQRL